MRELILFDMINQNSELLEQSIKTHHEHKRECADRFSKLESRKLKDSTRASVFGLIGGFLAVIGEKLWR